MAMTRLDLGWPGQVRIRGGCDRVGFGIAVTSLEHKLKDMSNSGSYIFKLCSTRVHVELWG